MRASLQLNDYEKSSAPMSKGPYLFFTRNAGLQNQSVLFIQVGRAGAPEVLIDPNTWSADGTVGLSVFVQSKDASYAVYGISQSGSDWHDYKVIDLASRKTLDDTIEWVKVSGVAWRRDGFFYSRYPAPPGSGEGFDQREPPGVLSPGWHAPVTGSADLRGRRQPAAVSHRADHRGRALRDPVNLRSRQGRGWQCAARLRSLEERHRRIVFTPLVAAISDDSFVAVDNVGDRLLVQTNRNAPNWRVVLIDPARPDEAGWIDVLPERSGPLQTATTAGGKLFATYLEDVATRAYVHGLDGSFESEVSLPGPGAAAGFDGWRDDTSVFYTFNSLSVPPTIYEYDIATGTSAVFRRSDVPGYDPERFETTQVFYTSRDGTRVPMFLVHRKGLTLDGNNPTLLYGYGGFNVVVAPTFSAAARDSGTRGRLRVGQPARRRRIRRVLAPAGTKLRKQNVFDDFIAAAEWLIANKYTSPLDWPSRADRTAGCSSARSSISGRSCFAPRFRVGVMDMLRFHKFTIGWAWVDDYGSATTRRNSRRCSRIRRCTTSSPA